jgi:hypothetical protein
VLQHKARLERKDGSPLRRTEPVSSSRSGATNKLHRPCIQNTPNILSSSAEDIYSHISHIKAIGISLIPIARFLTP